VSAEEIRHVNGAPRPHPGQPAPPWAALRRRRDEIGFVLVVGLALVAPTLMSDFRLTLLAKYLCFALVALGIGLAWGQGGMLTLGQGVFFGLGGYCMAMYLKLKEAPKGQLPDFMVYNGVEKLPWMWQPFHSAVFAIVAAVVLPAVVATLLGLLVFRQRVRGAYFAILSQALAAAFVILLIGQQGKTGGTNGMTNFAEFFGHPLAARSTHRGLYFLVAGVLAVMYLLVRQLVRSRFGRLLIAVRDGEDRVRFLGYDPTVVKTIAYAVSAALAGIAGALFVPIVGIMSPALLGVVPSIEFVIAVAIGGRYTLAGAVLGGVLFNWAKTNFSEAYPSGWLYLQGAMFIAVMTLAPRGVAGFLGNWREILRHVWQSRPAARPPAPMSPASRAALERQLELRTDWGPPTQTEETV
jgi:urea transport system permease protein